MWHMIKGLDVSHNSVPRSPYHIMSYLGISDVVGFLAKRIDRIQKMNLRHFDEYKPAGFLKERMKDRLKDTGGSYLKNYPTLNQELEDMVKRLYEVKEKIEKYLFS